MSSIQTLKSAMAGRVDVGRAERLYHTSRQHGGEYLAPPELGHDQYMRPVHRKNVTWLHGVEGAMHYPVHEVLADETNHRPVMQIGATGMRGHSDTMGKGRDLFPHNLYSRLGDSEYNRGRFVRQHSTCNGATPEHKPVRGMKPWSAPAAKWDRSHDAANRHHYRG